MQVRPLCFTARVFLNFSISMVYRRFVALSEIGIILRTRSQNLGVPPKKKLISESIKFWHNSGQLLNFDCSYVYNVTRYWQSGNAINNYNLSASDEMIWWTRVNKQIVFDHNLEPPKSPLCVQCNATIAVNIKLCLRPLDAWRFSEHNFKPLYYLHRQGIGARAAVRLYSARNF